MSKYSVICLSVLLGCAPLIAGDWSFGVGVGLANMSHDIQPTTYDPNINFIYELTPILVEQQGVKELTVSRRLGDKWSVEGAVTQLGSLAVQVVNDFHGENRRVFELNSYGVKLGVRRAFKINQYLGVTAYGGAFLWDQKVENDANDPLISIFGESSDEVLAAADLLAQNGVDVHGGGSLDFMPGDRVTFRLEAIHFKMADQSQTVLGMNFGLHF